MPPSQAGVAAAVASTSRQVGMTLGVAVIGAIAGGSVGGALGKGFAAATHPGWWVAVALGAVILALGFVTTSTWAEDTAARTAELFREDEPPPRRSAFSRSAERGYVRRAGVAGAGVADGDAGPVRTRKRS
jgi:hypothetical protein